MKSPFQVIVSVILVTSALTVSIKKEHPNSILKPNTFLATSQDFNPIIIDSGSGNIRVGFGGDDEPRSIFPSIIGTPATPPPKTGMSLPTKYVGGAALRLLDKLKIQHPIDRADKAPSWAGVEDLWLSAFDEIRAEVSGAPVLLTGRLLNKKEYREKIIEILFEKFNVPLLNFIHPAVAALYATGQTTGLVVNIGAGDLSVIPVCDNLPLSNAILTAPLGGNEVDLYLEQLLKKKGYEFKTPAEKDSVRKIKESLCFVDAGADINEAGKEFEVAPGRKIFVDSERWAAPEVLFKPSLIGVESEGIHTLIYNSIMKADPKVRNGLFNNIVLTGGSTLFNGMGERVRNEIRTLVSTGPVKVICEPQRGSLSWIGASMTSTLTEFQASWFPYAAYSEEGPSALQTFDYYKTS